MGVQKKEKVRKEREGKTGDGMGNVKVKGTNFYRYVARGQSSFCTFFAPAYFIFHRYTNRFLAMRRRSRSSSASQTAKLSAMPREMLPRPLSTKTAMRLSPVSSPTGNGSTTRE